jgi:hypothetical protein
MKTPVEELFELLWDTPKDKFTWYAIREQMLKKEKKQFVEFGYAFSRDYTTMKEIRDHYKETFNTNDK